MSDRLRFLAIHLVPVWLCRWLWGRVPLGEWTPHVLGRCIGAIDWERDDADSV